VSREAGVKKTLVMGKLYVPDASEAIGGQGPLAYPEVFSKLFIEISRGSYYT
jgi:hypothetical protein